MGVGVEAGETGVPVPGDVDHRVVDAVAVGVSGDIGIGRAEIVVGEEDVNAGVGGRGLDEADAEHCLEELERLTRHVAPGRRVEAVGVAVPATQVVADLAGIGVVAVCAEVVEARHGAGGLPIADAQVVGQGLHACGGRRSGCGAAAQGRGRIAVGPHPVVAAGHADAAAGMEAAVDRIEIDGVNRRRFVAAKGGNPGKGHG